ncbi:MAG: MFS transporter [Candidatus Dormibacteria bacterium]
MLRIGPRASPNPWITMLVLCLGFFMIVLDTTVVTVAVPSISDDLKATLDQVLWVVNAYLVVYAALLVTAGRLGDLIGRRLLFQVGIGLFTLASAACGLARTPGQLIAARVGQGVGGALMSPQTLAILTDIFPVERRGAAFGVWGAVAGLGAIAGPTLGGLMVAQAGWRSVFFINVPVGLAALVGSCLWIPASNRQPRRPLDLVGLGLVSAAILAIVFALVEGQRFSWGTIAGPLNIPVILVGGVLLLVVFAAWERGYPDPLMPVALFRDQNFALMNWAGAAIWFAVVGLLLPLTIYLQSVRGYSSLGAGLTLLPMTAAVVLAAPIAGRLADRPRGRYVLTGGAFVFGLGTVIIALSTSESSTWISWLPGLLVAGVGLGCAFATISARALRDVQPEWAGSASGVINTTRQLGAALGSAVVGAVLQSRLAVAMHDEAVARAADLPPSFRGRFVSEFDRVTHFGFRVGHSWWAGAAVPHGIPSRALPALERLARHMFATAYVRAMRPTMLVAAAAVFLGAAILAAAERSSRGGCGDRDDVVPSTRVASAPGHAARRVDGRPVRLRVQRILRQLRE